MRLAVSVSLELTCRNGTSNARVLLPVSLRYRVAVGSVVLLIDGREAASNEKRRRRNERHAVASKCLTFL